MSIIGSNVLAGAAGGAGAGAADYQIERSLRFNSGDSAYLNRTPSSASNRKTWTWSGWVKRSSLAASDQYIFGAQGSGSFWLLGFLSTHEFFINPTAGVTGATFKSNAKYRDPSAWYHIVVAVDTTQATASDRVRVYINGDEITSWATSTYPSQNTDWYVNDNVAHRIGSSTQSTGYCNVYLADIHFIDGQALDPTSFTETDANGVLQPKAYSASYGTNGFHLDFADNSTAAALGTDTSGNSNTWTVNNLSNVSGGPTSVSAASGGLPIYNTTDTYGTTKGTGTRTDSNSSLIVLAIPMDGANNDTTFTDKSATIKGSGSAKTITRYGDTKTSTAQSKYYGSSGYFDGTGDYLQVANNVDLQFGTGDFTIEGWFYVFSKDKS